MKRKLSIVQLVLEYNSTHDKYTLQISRGALFCVVSNFLLGFSRGVGSIFRLRGHQRCKPQIESRSRNLITK